ncbi:MAG: hypothetical protein QOF33_1780 [Thermomicrobiales bacterium]|jgi:hypothetical protein|nr:hypothetical protein [Thermomicrobiales bacterium]
MGADFFISYTHIDEAWAEWIAWHLHHTGRSVILQAWDFLPGSNFVHQMHQAAAKAERTIAVLSPAYLKSGFAEAEWAAAFARDPTGEKGLLVPVRVAECDVKGLLPQIVYIDFVGVTREQARDRLLQGISGERRMPASEPLFPGQDRSDAFPVPQLRSAPKPRRSLSEEEARARLDQDFWGAPPPDFPRSGGTWLGLMVLPEAQDGPYVDILCFGDTVFRSDVTQRLLSGNPAVLRTDRATEPHEGEHSLKLIQMDLDYRYPMRGVELAADGTVLFTGDIERRRRSYHFLADPYVIDERTACTTTTAFLMFASWYYRMLGLNTGDLYVGASLSGIDHKFIGIPPEHELCSFTFASHRLDDPLRFPLPPLKIDRAALEDAAPIAATVTQHAIRLFRVQNAYYGH